jgi:hypothetical protein
MKKKKSLLFSFFDIMDIETKKSFIVVLPKRVQSLSEGWASN